jgi:RHS repeat-associated protein
MPCKSTYTWAFCREGRTPLQVNLPDGRQVTLNQGDKFETNSPCEMLQFINALPSGENFQETRANTIESLNRDAQQAGCLAPGGGAGANPDAGTTSPGTAAAPPPGGDSAADQGAPQTRDGGQVSPPAGNPDGGVPGTNPDPPLQPQPGEGHTTHGGEQSRQSTEGGDPVDLFRGQFYLQETDLILPNTLMPLVFVRRYRSGYPNFGPFGWNWGHNHDVYLRELTTGDVARWNGALHEDVFRFNGADYDPPRGVFEQLRPVAGIPQVYEITGAGGMVWRFARPAGWTEAERIPLETIRDRHGNLLRYSYDGQNRVAEVRDDDDHFFTFHYGECGMLEALRDHTGRQVMYEHMPDYEHLAAVHFPPTGDHPEGIRRCYFYERLDAMPELRHNIVRVEDGSGVAFVENTYEQDPGAWHYARLLSQNTGGYLYQFHYRQLQYVPPDALFVNIPAVQVEVLAPDFGLTTYTFNYRGDLLDHRQRLSKDRSYRVVVWTYRYDAQGNLTEETRPDGSQELRVFDDANPDPRMRGNLLRRELTSAAGFPAPSRVIWEGQYDPNFQLLRQERAENGAVTRYRYDFNLAPGPNATGKLREIEYPAATLPDGTVQNSVTRFESNNRGQVTAVVTADGVRQENEYGAAGNELGRLVLQRSDVGGLNVTERFAYDTVGYLTGVTDGEGHTRATQYNALGQIEQRTAPAVSGTVAVVRLHYDASGQVTGMELPRGAYDDPALASHPILHQFERNAQGFVTRYRYAANTAAPRIIEQCSDYRGMPLETRQPDGAERAANYDERGLLLRDETTGPDGTRTLTRRVYERYGRITQIIEGLAGDRITRFEYDGFGRLTRTDMPNGSVIRYTWGPGDVLLEESVTGDPGAGAPARLLSRKRYAYDDRLRMMESFESAFREDPATAVELRSQFFYDPLNRLDRILDHRGGITRYQYDALGRLARLTDPEGNEQRYLYDAVGRLLSVAFHDVEPGGAVTRTWQMEYDARGRNVRSIEPDGTETRTEYDDRDLPVRRLEPEGVIRERSFGALGELLSDVLDPGGLALTNVWVYDDRGRPVMYTDPTGEVTRYFYDGVGRPVRSEYPISGAVARVFGADGRLSSETLPSGVQLQFGYDVAGRLRSIQSNAPAGVDAIANHQFAYDGLDRLVQASAGPVVTQRRYDSRGRLVEETGHGTALQLFYDDPAGTAERRWPDGRRERITFNLNGVGVRVQRLASGALGGGAAQMARVTLSGERHLGTVQLPGGLTASARYDQRKRLTSLAYRRGATVQEQADYRYDARGRRRIERLSAAPGAARYYRFDARDRLITADQGFVSPLGPGQSQADQDAAILAAQAAAGAAAAGAVRRLEYQYDAADARTLYRESGLPDRPYTYLPGHRMATAGAEVFTYAADGARRSDGAHTYRLDAFGRVVEVSAGGAVVLRLGYDGLGRPSTLQENGAPARSFSYFGSQVLQESQGGAAMRQISPHPVLLDIPLAIHTAGRTVYPLLDGHLNMVAVAGANGQVLERYRYEPFGAPAVFSPSGAALPGSAIGVEPAFGGMRYLSGAGLYLAQRRLMDPAHGVFLAPDTFEYLASPSLYAYAAQNPVDLVDPMGEFPFLAILGIMAVGALIGGGLNAARQGVQIAEGSRTEFSWGELGLSTGIGAIAAPILVFAPELAVPLAAYGVAGGISELSQGHYATGAFDIVTSVAPFGFKGPRTSTFGQGTVFGQMRGLGESATWSTRAGRFNEIDAASRAAISRMVNERFYRGTTAYEAMEAAEAGRLNLDQVLQRQQTAAASGERGRGLYFTETLEPRAAGDATYWAETHGGGGRGGGPAILEASISRWNWRWLSRQPGVVRGAEQSRFPISPSNRETYIPEALAPWFNEHATWRVVPDTPVPGPTFTPMWPTLFTPPLRTPGDTPAQASGQGEGAHTDGATPPANGRGAGQQSGPGADGGKK